MCLNIFYNLCLRIGLMVIILISGYALPSAADPAPLHFSTHYWKGRAVETTPFDLKVMSSGIYQIEVDDSASQHRSIQAIFDEAASFKYRKDGSGDSWQTPSVTKELKTGDCEDLAVWVYGELKKNGYAGIRIMVGKLEAADAAYHTWTVCVSPEGDDLIIDPALQQKIWKRSDLLPEIYLPFYSFDGQFKYAHF